MPISFDDLLTYAAGSVIYKGVTHNVLPITAPGQQLAERLDGDNPPAVEEIVVLARKLCPSLPEEFWTEAPAVFLGTIIGQSQGPLRKVEADLPNSSGPAATTAPAETSASLDG